jgi:uncharacterized protein YrrD
MRIEPGMTADSADGEFGKVADVVVDPVRRRVTHVVVEPSGWWQGPRLIGVESLTAFDDRIKLSCTTAEIIDAPLMQETDLPGGDGHEGMDVGVVRVFAWPYSPASEGLWGESWPGPAAGLDYGNRLGTTATYDLIPEGTKEIRRASDVVGSEGHVVGHVHGLITSPDFRITDLVIDRGHLWTHRVITIPIEAVESIDTDVVRLRVPRKTVLTFSSVPEQRHESP